MKNTSTASKFIKINTTTYKKWSLYYPAFISPVIMRNDALSSIIQKKLNNLGNHNVFSYLEIDSQNFIFATFPQENKVYIATQNLAMELLFLEHAEIPSEEQKTFKHFITEIQKCSQEKSLSHLQLITHEHQLENLEEEKWTSLKNSCEKETQQLTKIMSSYRSNIAEKISNFVLNYMAQDRTLLVHALLFQIVLPSLNKDENSHEVKKILLETLENLQKTKISFLKPLFKTLHFVVENLPHYFINNSVNFFSKFFASRFIVDAHLQDLPKLISKISKTQREATFDRLGELVVSPNEAKDYFDSIMELISTISLQYPSGEKNSAGIFKAHISIKVSALSHDLNPLDYEYSFQTIAPLLRKILIHAHKKNVFIQIDAEHYKTRDLILEIYSRTLRETPELENYQQTGIVVQTYLRDCAPFLRKVIELAKQRKLIMPIRLVKGAYWDEETIEARAHNAVAPQFLNKEETDLHFRQMIILALEAPEALQACIASHNISDHIWTEVARETYYPQASPIEHQCLHMTYEALSYSLAKRGYATRNYIPVGNLIEGMGYLVRRILENSSQEGFLFSSRKNKALSYHDPIDLHLLKKKEGALVKNEQIYPLNNIFKNVRPVLTYKNDEYQAFQNALSKKANAEVQEIILENLHGPIVQIFNPSQKDTLVGKISFANADDTKSAIDRVYNAEEWQKTSISERITKLTLAAIELTQKRYEIAALIVLESGKIIDEALGDVDEAIDFIHFYAQEVQQKKGIPRGVCGVITPWNFPLAIPVGMITAALLAGNNVIFKPAEQTPLVAYEFCKILWSLGINQETLCFLPAYGSEVGPVISSSPQVNMISFTGSYAVGKQLIQESYTHKTIHPVTKIPQQRNVVAEMGGKNAVIITASSDLDQVITSLLYACFSHSGQKCSAASRIIIHEKIKDRFLKRFIEATRSLIVGPSHEGKTKINTLIDGKTKTRLLSKASEALKEVEERGVIHYNGLNDYHYLNGHFVGPVILELPYIQALAYSSFSHQELFAPVVHLIPFKNIEQAIELHNCTNYALTSGIFSQSQKEIEYLLSELDAGNIYVNRHNTGARVSIEPFGGFKNSGTGPKAGGKDYLNAFLIQHSKQEEFLDVDQAIRKKVFNRDIPGQISYNNYERYISTVAIFASRATKSEKLSKLKEVLQERNIDYHIYEYISENGPEVFQDIYDLVIVHDQEMLSKIDLFLHKQKQIFKLLDISTLSIDEIAPQLQSLLVYPRSIAINTMHYGASLEV